MKRLFNLLLLLVVSASLYAQYKVDTMCGAKVILHKNGKLLSRYEPQTPGAGYLKSVELAVNFWKNCPVSKDNKLPLYITHCSMYRDGKGGFFGSSWPHNPIVVNAGMVQSLAIDWRNFSGDESMLDIARKGLDVQIWERDLKDGSKAVGLFNTGLNSESVTLNFSDIQLKGKQKVRNLWLHKNIGSYKSKFCTKIEPHGVILLKVKPCR